MAVAATPDMVHALPAAFAPVSSAGPVTGPAAAGPAMAVTGSQAGRRAGIGRGRALRRLVPAADAASAARLAVAAAGRHVRSAAPAVSVPLTAGTVGSAVAFAAAGGGCRVGRGLPGRAAASHAMSMLKHVHVFLLE